MKLSIGTCIFFFAFAGCLGIAAADNKPAWVDNLEGAYPKAAYLTGQGTGDTLKAAEADSASALAQQFSVSVQSETVDYQRYTDLTKGSSTQSSSEDTLTKTIGLTANEQFLNLRFSAPYSDASGVVHVLAYLERKPTGVLYRSRIDKDWATVDQFVGRVDKAPSILARYALYDAGYQVARDAQRMAGQLQIIDPQGPKGADHLADFQALAQKRDNEGAKLTYKIDIQGDKDGKVTGLVKKTLGTLGFSANPAGTLSVSGTFSSEPVSVNVDFKSVHWSLNITLTDENGSAVATVVKESRENGITEAAAQALVFRQLDKQIGLLLTKAVEDDLTRMALQP